LIDNRVEVPVPGVRMQPFDDNDAFEEAAIELEVLQNLLQGGIDVPGVSTERQVCRRLERIWELGAESAAVHDACQKALQCTARVFAVPSDWLRIAALHSALGVISMQLRRARAERVRRLIALGELPERRLSARA
jgi:hypothetical protein